MGKKWNFVGKTINSLHTPRHPSQYPVSTPILDVGAARVAPRAPELAARPGWHLPPNSSAWAAARCLRQPVGVTFFDSDEPTPNPPHRMCWSFLERSTDAATIALAPASVPVGTSAAVGCFLLPQAGLVSYNTTATNYRVQQNGFSTIHCSLTVNNWCTCLIFYKREPRPNAHKILEIDGNL